MGVTVLFALALGGVLLAITVIDLRSFRIPDTLNLTLAGLGLAWAVVDLGAVPMGRILAGLAIAGLMWAVREGYLRRRGVVGLGLGDVKMAGAAALWVSPWNLPLILLVACITALIVVGFQADRSKRLAFGPYIALGLVVTWGAETMGLPTLLPPGTIP